MARKLRIQYPGAMYHVVNRGNYRRDLFLNPAEAKAFLDTVREAKERMRWRVHAYALMRNHYHLAIETPEPNLAEGMHWLQGTWANRFNRFRKENGQLFQGRYRSILIENIEVMAKVVDYIHLNPVRAKIVSPEHVKAYRWTSLAGIVRGDGWIDGDGWRGGGRFSQSDPGRRGYEEFLIEVGRNEKEWEKLGLNGLSEGWAIGTSGWRRAMAKEHGQRALNPGLELREIRELREGAWEHTLQEQLKRIGRDEAELQTYPKRQSWKVELATAVRACCGASVVWLAQRLALGKPSSVRSYLCRHFTEYQQTTPRPL
jgi:REP element-mobilizing transposase RayT